MITGNAADVNFSDEERALESGGEGSVGIAREEPARGDANSRLRFQCWQHRINGARGRGGGENILAGGECGDGGAIVEKIKMGGFACEAGAEFVGTLECDVGVREQREQLAVLCGNLHNRLRLVGEGFGGRECRTHALERSKCLVADRPRMDGRSQRERGEEDGERSPEEDFSFHKIANGEE